MKCICYIHSFDAGYPGQNYSFNVFKKLRSDHLRALNVALMFVLKSQTPLDQSKWAFHLFIFIYLFIYLGISGLALK